MILHIQIIIMILCLHLIPYINLSITVELVGYQQFGSEYINACPKLTVLNGIGCTYIQFSQLIKLSKKSIKSPPILM